MEQNKQRQVNMSFRDLKIKYLVDGHSIEKMAKEFNVDWSDMKQALRDYGFTIRQEVKPLDNPKEYCINLIDTDKIVQKEEKVKENNVVVS